MNKGFLLSVLAVLGFLNLAVAQQKMKYTAFSDLLEEVTRDSEHITVLNIWATWCKPCVAEIPEFEKLNKNYEKNGVRVILGNVDFHSQADTLVNSFIRKKDIRSEVIHITDQDSNDWIGDLKSDWSGEIPVTAIYYNGKQVWFYSGQTEFETLENIVTKYFN